MKKIYFLMMAMLMTISAFAQVSTEEVPFVFAVKVTDPSVCHLVDQDYQPVELTGTETVVETVMHVTDYGDGNLYTYIDSYYLYINDDVAGDYTISGCKMQINGETFDYPGFYYSTTNLNLTSGLYADYNGCTLLPEISNLAEMRTSTATVNVDDASLVRIRCGYGGYSPELVDGVNTIAFNPETESQWTIGPANYGGHLGGVTLNGEPVEEYYGSFDLTVHNNDVVDITAQTSNDPLSVNIVTLGAPEAVKAVYKYVDYVRIPVENWQSGFEVLPYQDIIIAFDTDNYNISMLTVNDVTQYLYSDELYVTITENTNITVMASKYSTFSITLNISNPDQVTVELMDTPYSGGQLLENLVVGEQTIQVSQKKQVIRVAPKSGVFVDEISCTIDGVTTPAESSYYGYYMNIAEGATVTVITHEKQRDASATLWVNNMDNVYVLYLKYGDDTEIFDSYGENVPTTGAQTFAFDPESDNPVILFFSPKDYETPGYVTINDQLIQPKYEGSTSYEFNLADGDYICVYAGVAYGESGIEGVDANAVAPAVYDIKGNKLPAGAELTPGFYIINGKKVLVK